MGLVYLRQNMPPAFKKSIVIGVSSGIATWVAIECGLGIAAALVASVVSGVASFVFRERPTPKVEDELMARLSCPISRCVMVDPVVAGDGVSYERHEFNAYTRGRARVASPVTRSEMASDVRPNLALKAVAELVMTRVEGSDATEYYLAEGERCARRGDLDRAMAAFQRAQATGDARATTHLAWCSYAAGDTDAAARLYDEAERLGDEAARAGSTAVRAFTLLDSVKELTDFSPMVEREAAASAAHEALALVSGPAANGAILAREAKDRAERLLEQVRTLDVGTPSRLVAAAVRGDVATVRELLERGVDVEYKHKGVTALLAASDYGHVAVVDELLAVADVNATCSCGEHALIKASRDDESAAVVAALLGVPGCDVNKVNSAGQHALICACVEGAVANVTLLLEDGRADVNLVDASGESALVWAIDMAWIPVVECLLRDPRLDVELPTRHGDTPLMRAATFCRGDARIVELLAPRAILDAQTANGHTACLLASNVGNADVVATLLAHGANANIADDLGSTPLLWAVYKGHVDVVDILLSWPAIDVNCVDNEADTPLIVACSEGNGPIVQRMLQVPHLDLNHINNHDLTALDCAVNENHIHCADLVRADARLVHDDPQIASLVIGQRRGEPRLRIRL